MGSTSGHEITHPITVILDGLASYHSWSQNMIVFLKGRRLWHYVTGDIPKLVPRPVIESSDKTKTSASVAEAVIPVNDFEACLEEWESIQCKILSWFINTSIPAISSLPSRLETGQAAWSFLTASMWEQLAAADPPLRYAEDIDLFAKYKDHRRFTQFMMGLREDFEPTRATLLSCSPLPSLDVAVKELIYEENQCPHHHLSSSDVVLATPCHDISECYRKQKDDKKKHHQSRGLLPRPQAAAVSSAPIDDSVLTVSQLESRFHRYMSQPSITSGNKSWLFDSVCCNHMTPHASHFSEKMPLAPSPIIYTTDSSHMSISHIGTVFSPDLTIPNTYLVLSVGQLCELGLNLHFFNHGVDMQDPLTSKLLGTSHKIGRLFELCNLQIPSHMVPTSVATTTTLSPNTFSSRQYFPFISSSMTPIFIDPSIALYPNPVRDSTPPPSSSDVPYLVLSPPESSTDLRRSTREAMVDVFDALHKTHTWDMTTLPLGKIAVSCKWVYKIKTRADGSVEHYKMDVKNVFFNGDLLKKVYMQPPPGYPDSQNQVYRLRCALYGLKQAPRACYFLSLEVTSSSDGYYLSQAKYTSDLLSKIGLLDSKTVSTPLELNVKLNATDGEPLSDATLYR
uniref:Reverse transcriptase Ty1/copia-type domain-containing protein n=1 Tax=Fagus sylvatica TaxID=28930 RepID=A0A2N9FEA6_FAGSY